MKKLIPILAIFLCLTLTLPVFAEECEHTLFSQNISEETHELFRDPSFRDDYLGSIRFESASFIKFYTTDMETLSALPLSELVLHCEGSRGQEDHLLVNYRLFRVTENDENELSSPTMVKGLVNSIGFAETLFPIYDGERSYYERNAQDIYAFFTGNASELIFFVTMRNGKTFVCVCNENDGDLFQKEVLSEENFRAYAASYAKFTHESASRVTLQAFVKALRGKEAVALSETGTLIPQTVTTVFSRPAVILSALSGVLVGACGAFGTFAAISKKKKQKKDLL